MAKTLKVNLKNLSNKGLDFYYKKGSSLNIAKKLQPLIGNNEYIISVHMKSKGKSAYIVLVDMKTQINLSCSRCAHEFKKPICKKIKETIFLQQKRKEKENRINHFSQITNQDHFTVTTQKLFDLGDFLHELITIEQPIRPLGTKNCDKENFRCEHLENIKKNLKKNKNNQIFFS